MKYKIVHTRETDNYTRYLEELSEKGFRVISAGMTANPALKCFDWWAILEEVPREITVKLPEEPKDEEAGLLKAAREISKYCKGREDCPGCPLADKRKYHACRVIRGDGGSETPENWPIAKEV